MNTTTNTTRSVTLAIDGMSCGHCVQAVTKALSAVPGVKVQPTTKTFGYATAGSGPRASQGVRPRAEAAVVAPWTAATDRCAATASGDGRTGGAARSVAMGRT